MNWSKSLTAALIAVVTLTPMPNKAQPSPTPSKPQSSPNLPGGVYSLPDQGMGSSRQGQQNFVGLVYQALPLFSFNLQDLGGWIVGEPKGSYVYSIAHIQTGTLITDAPKAQKHQMLWLETIRQPPDPDPQGNPSYHVLAVLNLPPLRTTDVLVGNPGQLCAQNGKRDPEVIAIATYTDTNYLQQIKQAWRADRKAGKFESIPARNVVCDNTSRRYR